MEHTSTISVYETLNSTDQLETDTGIIQRNGNREMETARMIILPTFSVIILFGTIGNLLTFVVMQRGSLKNSSTCFYMAMLALADTGRS